MSIINILQASAEFAILIPAALICILPVMKHSKVSRKLLLAVTVSALIVISFICGIIKVQLSLDSNAFLIPVMLLALIFYFTFFRQSKKKLWYLFISVTAIFSFAGLSSYIIEAHINADGNIGDLQSYGLIVQWIIALIFLIASVVFLPKIEWLMDDYHLNAIWKFVWLVPAFITATNILMIPEDYSTVSVGRLFEIYIVTDAVLLLLYVLFQIMLYIIAKAITDKSEAELQARMLSIQATEYKNLKKYIEDTSRLRHDFLHMARAARQLAKSNDTETLIHLIDSYGVSIDTSHCQKIFCAHNALNAIVGYYYDEALKHNIKCNCQISLSDNITVSDVDLCSVTGNLLDNAIQGCLTVEESKRYISFKADTEKNGDIYIVVTNSFDGVVKKQNGKYTSTKENGNGIGLESIKTTVNKHNGYVKFYNDKKNFYSDIMMKQ
ncbi:MAG: ATP-binding protein [Ruminococcus sp.]